MREKKELKYLIHYYLREKYYQTVENLTLEGIKNYPDDNSFKLFNCFARILSSRSEESIRELELLINVKDVRIGAILALISAYKLCEITDKETVIQLENKLKVERKNSTDLSLYYGALYLYFTDKCSKSKEYLEKFIKSNPDSSEGLTLKGWLDVSTNKISSYDVAETCFNLVLDKEKKNLDASLGLIKVKEKQNNVTDALSLLNQLIVKFPNLTPPFIEKMKIQLIANNWDLALETANRILTIDNKCIEAYKIKTLVLICRDGNFDEAASSLRKLYNELENSEKKNGKLYLENAQLFSYISGKNPKLLHETYCIAEKAVQLEPSNPDFLTELGNQNLLQGNIKEAIKFFKNSTKLDESSISALTGLTLCQIEQGILKNEVKQQVEFLREIRNEQPTPQLLLMSAKLTENISEALSFLNQAVTVHFDSFKKYPFGVSYLHHLNPVFLMQIVHEYLKYAPSNSEDLIVFKKTPEPFSKSLMILEELTGSCPGLIEAQYEYAYVQFLVGNFKKAKQILTHILDNLDATFAEAYILMAQIHLCEKNYGEGESCLEVGLSYNFKIREHPVYHIISAMVQKENGNITECINSLKSAMDIANLQNKSKADGKPTAFTFSLNNKADLYLELINAYQKNNQLDEASKIMELALDQLKGSCEEGRIMIAKSQMLIEQGKVSQGIENLEKIQSTENHYILAKKTLANVYLIHKKNREMFAECYKDLVENCPNAETYSMLGDAYMLIQEANLAIEAYEQALKTNSKDVNLMCKLGKALVKTHYFSKAINYYREAIKNEEHLQIIYDLSELYFKLGQLESAEKVLVNVLEKNKNDLVDVNQLVLKTKLFHLLAKVRDKSGNLTESLTALQAAKEYYDRIDKRILSQSDGNGEILSKICSDTAVLLTRLRDFKGAIKCYKESLVAKPDDSKNLVAICRLYMQINEFQECQVTSKKLLDADPNNEPAVIMLADLAFKKVDFETAAYYFKQLLSKKPTYWTALSRLIEVMRRMGNLEEALPFLEKAENFLLQPLQSVGYSYCKGLYERYSERPAAALHHFNRARRNSEWGQRAVSHMIEICLNPENETFMSDAFADEMDKEEVQSSREVALRTAQRLLDELKTLQTSDDSCNYRLLVNFWLLATNQKVNIEKSQQDFIVMATQDLYKEHVGVALGISTSYVLQKQSQKARNHLKRVIKTPWNYEDAEYLERAWLLLTDIYIQAGKMDVPVDLIQRILQHNKSCYKAYDYAGIIAEKEQLYKEAAVQYENAWRYCGQTNPSIGYKLAFNYLKGKRYADAIDVCYTILKLYPDYPRIQKEILEKAKTNLRT